MPPPDPVPVWAALDPGDVRWQVRDVLSVLVSGPSWKVLPKGTSSLLHQRALRSTPHITYKLKVN